MKSPTAKTASGRTAARVGRWVFCGVLGGTALARADLPTPALVEILAGKSAPAAAVAPVAAKPSPMLAALEREDTAEAAKLARAAAEAGDADAQFFLGLLHDLGLGVSLSFEESNRWMERAAAGGHYWSRLYLGWKIRQGFGVPKPDPRRGNEWQELAYAGPAPAPIVGREWLQVNGGEFVPRFDRAAPLIRRAADAGDAVAMATWAEYHLLGLGIPRSTERHIEWLRKAAAAGSATAAARLKLYYGVGLWVTQDSAQEQQYLRRAAELGEAESQYELARALHDGDHDAAADPAGAIAWYRRAAAQDHVRALVKLADLLRAGAPGAPRDDAEALRLTRRAVELGDAEAMADLAGMLREGRGTPPDAKAALELYRQASAKGNSYATMMVGWMHAYPDGGAPPDFATAREWFEKAAAAGSAVAMRELGRLYFDGNGVPADKPRAFEWTERAARDGDTWSQNRLGWMLRQGIGIERDDEEAVTWFKLAAKNGEPWADANLGFHYANGVGVPRDAGAAFDHLAKALRRLSDPWTENVFAGLLNASGAEAALIKEKLGALIAAPDFWSAEGTLPELCVLGAIGLKRADARDLLSQLEKSGRPMAPSVLAHCAFTGLGRPYDLAAARKWAQAASRERGGRGEVTILFIESVAAESAEERERCARELNARARAGEIEAAAAEAAVQACFPTPEMLRELVPDAAELTRREQALGDRGENVPPTALCQFPPIYPMALRASGLEGKVSVLFRITEEGKVDSIEIKSAAHPLLALSARASIAHWRYAPARKNGQPVATRALIDVPFTLAEETVPARP